MAEGTEAAALFVTVRAITAQFNEAMAEVNSKIAGAGKSMQTAGAAMSSAGKKMTHNVTLPLLGIAAAGAKMSLDFHAQMQLVQTQAGGTAADVKVLSKAVEDLAKSTTQGPDELAKGMYHLKSLGLDNATAMTTLKVASEGAMVGMAPLEDTVNALGGAMRTYHMNSSQAKVAMAELNATVGAGNMRFADMLDALSTGVLPAARLAGLSIHDVGAALATMTDEGMPANSAMTRFKTSLSMLAAPSQSAAKALAKIGLTGSQLGMDMHRGIVPTIADLQSHLAKLGGGGVISQLTDSFHKGKISIEEFQKQASQTAQFQALSRIMGGGRTAATVMLLVNQLDVLKQKYQQIGRTAGNFDSSVLAAQHNQLNQLKIAWSSVQVALIKIGDVVVPILADVMKHVASVADAFSRLPAPVQHVAVIIGLLVAAVGPMLSIIGAVVGAIGTVAFTFGTLGAAIFGTGEVAGLVAAGPILVMLGALVALGVGLYEAYTHVAGFRDLVNSAFRVISEGVKIAMQFVKAQINSVVSWAKGFWQRNGAEIIATANRMKAMIEAAFRAIVAVARAVWPTVAATIKAAWNVIRTVVSAGAKVIEDVMRVAMDLILGKWGKAWADLKKLVVDYLHGIERIIKSILSGLASIVYTAAKTIGVEIMHGIEDGVTGLAGELAAKVKGAVMGAVHGVMGHLGIHSPSTYTRDHVGKPIGQGIIAGYLEGINPLSSKMDSTMRVAVERARSAILSQQSAIKHAFSTLTQDADSAFTASTKQMVAKLKATMDSEMSTIDARLKKTLATIQSQGAAQTPAEKQAAALQSQINSEQYQHELSGAQQQLAQAQAGGDQQAILDAQFQLNQLLEQHQLDALNQQAQVERTARDKQTKQREDAAKARAAKEKAAVKKHYTERKAALDAERALEKKSMDQRMKALEAELVKDPMLWKKEHLAILKLFKKDIGPSMFDSGSKLGKMFASGIRDAFADITNAAREAAAILARYLQLHSPAKDGPLSTLDTWWKAFAPTLLGGLDMRAISGAATRFAAGAPTLAVAGVSVGAVAGAAGGSGVIHLHVESPTYLDGKEVARNSRDHLVRMGRYNGGDMLRGQG